MALDEAFNALLAGVRDGDRSAIWTFARAAGLIRGPWAEALVAYPARRAWQVSRKGKPRAELAREDAGCKVRSLNPRRWDYILRAARSSG